MRTTKAQHLTLTTLFIVFLFFLIVTLFFDELLINPRIANQRYDHLQREASRAISILASNGYPENWTIDSVQRAGILSHGTYNQTKVSALATMEHATSKECLGITDNYLLNITNNGTTTMIASGVLTNKKDLVASHPRYLATQTKVVTSSTGLATITIYLYRRVP